MKSVNSKEKRNSKTKSNQTKLKDAAREINRGAKKASKVTPDAARRQAKGLIKNVLASGKVAPASPLMTWAKLLADPFGRPSSFCPVNYNPAPSFIQSLARTTSTNLNLIVAANSSSQMTLFPGHYLVPGSQILSSAGGDGMDAVSYHSMLLSFAGTNYCVGPMNENGASGPHASCIGHVMSGVAPGQTYGSSTGGVSGSALTWDVSLPYVHDSGSGHAGGAHTRWQLVSMGVRIHNITPELTRGGNVVSVIPNNVMSLGNVAQSTLEVYPTFHDWGVGDDGLEVTWIPRAQDLAFWHTQTSSAGLTDSKVAGPGILIYLNAGTTNQNYSYEVVCHWQLAGTYLNQVGGPAPHNPELKPTVEKTVGSMLNSQPTASLAPRVVEMAHANDGASSTSQTLIEKLAYLKDAAVHTAGVAAAGYAFGRRRALGPA